MELQPKDSYPLLETVGTVGYRNNKNWLPYHHYGYAVHSSVEAWGWNGLYNGKAKSEQNPNKSVSDPTSSTLPLPSSDSLEITPSEMEQIHSLEEIPDNVREQLLVEDMEQFHEQREM